MGCYVNKELNFGNQCCLHVQVRIFYSKKQGTSFFLNDGFILRNYMTSQFRHSE